MYGVPTGTCNDAFMTAYMLSEEASAATAPLRRSDQVAQPDPL